MKNLPTEDAKTYGDRTFGLMMMAKVICVQLVNELGYDLLFQDVGEILIRFEIMYIMLSSNDTILTPTKTWFGTGTLLTSSKS
jgi:hypothetical protein